MTALDKRWPVELGAAIVCATLNNMRIAKRGAIMERRILNPKSLHTPFSAYSHGIMIDGASRLIFCAGQVAGDRKGNIIGKGDFDAQGEQVFANLRDVLAEAGASLSDVVKATIFVVGQEYAQPGRDLCGRHWDAENPPANTLVVCQALADPDFLVEVQAIAVV
jgi:enamine deaminase RidA (YjgF/YER057c/UK114 family)